MTKGANYSRSCSAQPRTTFSSKTTEKGTGHFMTRWAHLSHTAYTTQIFNLSTGRQVSCVPNEDSNIQTLRFVWIGFKWTHLHVIHVKSLCSWRVKSDKIVLSARLHHNPGQPWFLLASAVTLLRVENFDNFSYFFPAYRAAVASVEQWLGALTAGDHVVTRVQHAVADSVHANRAVSVILRHRDWNEKVEGSITKRRLHSLKKVLTFQKKMSEWIISHHFQTTVDPSPKANVYGDWQMKQGLIWNRFSFWKVHPDNQLFSRTQTQITVTVFPGKVPGHRECFPFFSRKVLQVRRPDFSSNDWNQFSFDPEYWSEGQWIQASVPYQVLTGVVVLCWRHVAPVRQCGNRVLEEVANARRVFYLVQPRCREDMAKGHTVHSSR